MFYYQKAIDKHYIPIIKFPVCDAMPLNGNETVVIKNNRDFLLKTSNDLIPMRLASDMTRNLLFSILRSPDTIDRYKLGIKQCGKSTMIYVYINTTYINDLATNFYVAPHYLSVVIRSVPPKTDASLIYDIETCVNTKNYSNIPCLHRLAIKPYEYQLSNMEWMNNVEKTVDLGFHKYQYLTTNDLLRLKTKSLDLYMDPISHILYNDESIWETERVRTIKLSGGVICDEMGLGKTFTVISLSLINPRKSEIVISNKRPPVKKKTITINEKPKSENGKIRITPKLITPSSNGNGNSGGNGNGNGHCPHTSKATLVLCPRRLVSQWLMEIDKYLKHPYKMDAIEMSTMVHVKKYSYHDLAQKDIVVASFSLMQNKNYEIHALSGGLDLTKIKWHRLVIDEGHEILLHNIKKVDDMRIGKLVFGLQATYKWVCTGTPLPKLSESMSGILSYLSGMKLKEESDILSNISQEEFDRLKQLIFHRNTKQSTINEVYIPPPQESTDFLEFSEIEKGLYDAAGNDTLRQIQLCTNIMVSDADTEIIGGRPLSLDQVNKTMLTYYRDELEKQEAAKVNTIKEQEEFEVESEELLEILESRIADMTARLKQNKYNLLAKEQLEELTEELKREKARIYGKKRTFKNQIETVTESIALNAAKVQQFSALDTDSISKQYCSILGTPLKNTAVVITPHGYVYSAEAIKMLFHGKKSIFCPQTRVPLVKEDLLTVDLSTSLSTKSHELSDPNINKWGTKMAHLVKTVERILGEDCTNRIIIFSQWKKMLDLVGMVLNESNIKFVFCRGNVHVMSKSIRNFKTDNTIKVILLSSESCSSGSNLTEATHIILLDTVNTNPENARAIENQAISRSARLGQSKNVIVKRFIIKNTIEEQYYNSVNKLPSSSS
jgi:DNA repair protein RAD5